MSQGVPYSTRQQALFYPAKSLDSFPAQRPKSDAELCAWMACWPMAINTRILPSTRTRSSKRSVRWVSNRWGSSRVKDTKETAARTASWPFTTMR